MKASEITQIIEANPQAIFYHKTIRRYFTIEGFTTKQRTRYATPTKVAITRSVWISVNENNEGVIKIATDTDTTVLTSIGGESHTSADAMCKSMVKAAITDQAVRAKMADNAAVIKSLATNYIDAFAHHEIATTWKTIQGQSNGELVLTLTIAQAQALLCLIEG